LLVLVPLLFLGLLLGLLGKGLLLVAVVVRHGVRIARQHRANRGNLFAEPARSLSVEQAATPGLRLLHGCLLRGRNRNYAKGRVLFGLIAAVRAEQPPALGEQVHHTNIPAT
jgi:hypothetical protein